MAATAPRPRSGSRPSEVEDAPRRFLARRVPSGLAPEQAVVHDRLVAVATERPAGEARRRPFVALDGTPLVYSATSTGGFRMLAEPGALDRDVPAQVDFALTVLDELLGELEWRGAADDVNALVRAAMPRRAPDARLLRGGAALGLACGPRFELRLYLDLRGADVLLRWQRVADVLGQFGGPAAERSFVRLLARVEQTAVPVGLAAVLADGALRGLRLYVGVEHADASTLTLATALPASLLGPFCRLLGPFGTQRVTAAFDFALVDGGLHPAIGRTKVDACRLGVADAPRQADGLATAYGLDAKPLRAFLDDLDESFGGSTIQYLGAGLRGDAAELTVYAQPDGLARG